MNKNLDELLTAVYRKDRERVERLLSSGGDINGVDDDGRTPLMHAILDSEPDSAFVKQLIAHGANVNIVDTVQRWTPLHFAARDQKADLVTLLLRAGADVDAQDVFGNTPLWRAVMAPTPSAAVLRALRNGGADAEKANAKGVSPSEVLRRRGLTDLETELKSR